MPAMTESEVKVPTDLVSPERIQLLLPKLTDEQLATLKSHGVTEQTSAGQVLATAGDLTYDLTVVLEGEVECSDIFEVIEGQQPSFLFGRSVLATGEVPRTTGYELGLPAQQAWLGGRWEPDPLILDEQALIVDILNKGLLVITGCGHAGIVNICRYARRLTKERPLYTVMGGFHLSGPLSSRSSPRVLDDLGALMPSVIVPGHCTGWRALHALAARFCEASRALRPGQAP